MNKWLIGLAAAGAAGMGTYLMRRARKRRAVVILSRFIAALKKGRVKLHIVDDGIRIRNGVRYRVAEYFGELDGTTFRFVLEQKDLDRIRTYSLYWKDVGIVKASAEVRADGEETHGFATVHKLLSMIEVKAFDHHDH